MELKYILLAVACLALVFLIGKLLFMLIGGDPGAENAAAQCAEIAWKLEHANATATGDADALNQFDIFWGLVKKHSLDHEMVGVASFKTVLKHACLAFEKRFPGDVLQKHQSEKYYKAFSGEIDDYLDTQYSQRQTA
ncbi:MAG: hypothetical protein QG640_78 [Patescibacteria group bacterium]|nr:hypothetical protein [Patescibacteria group bacterium]